MLDFLGTVATAALIVFVISTLLVFMEASRGAKLWLAALLGLWVGIAAAGSAAGWAATARPFPIMGIFVATPLAAAALATAWPAALPAAAMPTHRPSRPPITSLVARGASR